MIVFWTTVRSAVFPNRAVQYDDIYRMDEIKSLSFHIMFYRLFRGVAKYIVYGVTYIGRNSTLQVTRRGAAKESATL